MPPKKTTKAGKRGISREEQARRDARARQISDMVDREQVLALRRARISAAERVTAAEQALQQAQSVAAHAERALADADRRYAERLERHGSPDECPVCRDTMQEGAVGRMPCCMGAIHRECFGQWCAVQARQSRPCTCPMCRGPVEPEPFGAARQLPAGSSWSRQAIARAADIFAREDAAAAAASNDEEVGEEVGNYYYDTPPWWEFPPPSRFGPYDDEDDDFGGPMGQGGFLGEEVD